MPRTDAGVPVKPCTTSTPSDDPATCDHASHPAMTSAVEAPAFIPSVLPAVQRARTSGVRADSSPIRRLARQLLVQVAEQVGVAGGDHGDEGVDDIGIELSTAARCDELCRLDPRPRPLVRALAAQ